MKIKNRFRDFFENILDFSYSFKDIIIEKNFVFLFLFMFLPLFFDFILDDLLSSLALIFMACVSIFLIRICLKVFVYNKKLYNFLFFLLAFVVIIVYFRVYTNIIFLSFSLLLPMVIFPKFYKKYLIFVIIFLWMPYYVNIMHRLLFNLPLNSGSLASIFNMNKGITKSFLSEALNLKVLFFTFLYFMVCFYLFFKIKNKNFLLNNEIILKVSFLSFVSAFIILSIKSNFNTKMLPFYIYDEYLDFKAEKEKIKLIMANRKFNKFTDIKSDVKNDDQELYVIIITDSVNRDHLSVYGYDRNTTPYLSSIMDELYIFNNVRSPHAVTILTLKKALTFSGGNEEMLAFNKGSIINYFKDAGFKTFWFSNHFISGPSDDLIAIYGSDADESVFLNKSMKWYQDTHFAMDGDLLEHFNMAINDKAKKKVIFLHILGSHFVYKDRYTKDFNIFNDRTSNEVQNKINQYDNSILYSDNFIKNIIESIKNLEFVGGVGDTKKLISYVLYFSDHADDVNDGNNSTFFHYEGTNKDSIYEIPFILWLSEDYKTEFPSFADNIKKFAGREYNIKFLIHSIIHLSNLSNNDFKINRSIFSDKYSDKVYIEGNETLPKYLIK